MKSEGRNIFSVFDELIQRHDKEGFLNQRSKVVWICGLSGSGKTTIAKILERKLLEEGYFTKLLDGDNVRSGLNNNLGFSEADRSENIRRIAEVSKLFLDGGVICINCFVSPTKAIRNMAKEIVGEADFIEVFVDTPLAVCEARDTKGLYAKARKGEIKDFTGISAPFEAPENAIRITTVDRSAESAADELLSLLRPKLKLNNKNASI